MKLKWPIGTFINMGTVLIGSAIGLGLQQAFSEAAQQTIFQAIGLGTVVLGVLMSIRLPDGYLLNFMFSLIIGGLIGLGLGLAEWFENLGESLRTSLELPEGSFTEGLITAFILFCIGSMTIVGAIEEGLQNKKELLLVKSLLDGIASIAFAATYGVGVAFSVIPMLVFQGGITVLAQYLAPFFTETMIKQVSAVGGALIIGIAINILQLGDITLENLLPALLVTALFTWGQEHYLPRRPN